MFGTAIDEIVAGDGRGCLIRVEGDGVQERHLVVRVREGGWVAEAVGPTFVAGERRELVAIDAPVLLRLGERGPQIELAPAREALRDATIDVSAAGSRGGAASTTGTAEQPPTYSLGGGVLRIGRDPSSDVVVDDVLVSRRHAEIRRKADGGYEVADLGSHNGTFVNGRRTAGEALAEGDVVIVGRTSYRLADDVVEAFVDSGEVAYAAVDLAVVLPNGTRLLDGVTFSLESRALLGVVGPSGSGKSTLLKALTGFDPATTGEVRYGDQSLYDDYDALRRRIGYVPQDDVVHPELTVRRALEFAADLRFPADVGVEERRARVSEVIEELGLGERADVRVDRLSGGQRKRVSVALELLTGPSLLFLDEPTSGLDPNYERTLMELFRGLADGGRTVVVVTHSTQSLRLCDRVLVLAPGGRLAYFGPPQLLLAYFDREDMPDVFRDLADRADVDWGAAFREHEYHDEYVERTAAREAAAAAVIEEAPPARAVPRRIVVRGRGRQFSTLLRRNAAVLTADRRNLALVLAQAPLLGLLMLLALPGDELAPAPSSEFRLISQASLILLVIVLGVSWLGMSNAIGAIAKEMPIYRRDRAAGVSITAYLAAKVVVLGVVTVAQAVVLVALATAGQGGPRGAVLFGLPLLELMVAASLTGLAAMTAGLFLSALLRTPERASSVLPIVLVFLLILALGGVFPEIGTKPGLKQLGYVASTQWGFAQMASTTDLNDLQSVTGVLTRVPSVNVDDPSELFEAFNRGAPGDARWDHTATAWIGDAAALCGLALLWLLGAGLALRRLDRQQRRRS